MHALMQERGLLISDILAHAARYHRGARVISVLSDGRRVRHDYPLIAERASRLAGALAARGVEPGERVATLAWNDHRHLEAYYAVPGMGAVCHTVNPRLFPEQIAFILREGGATHLLCDPQFLPLVAALLPRIGPALRTVVVLAEVVPEGAGAMLPGMAVLGYEALLAAASPDPAWPRFDERTASSLCYTSGTTGEPKGVLYSHRSTVLHAMALALPDAFGLRATDTVMPAVPMFHVNGWGLPYAAPLVGASLVLPGPRLDGASLHALIVEEGVNQAAGVPTIWSGLLAHLRTGDATLPPLRLVIGGSALPPVLAEGLEERGATALHAWGMTETSPLGTFNAPKPEDRDRDALERRRHLGSQGRPGFGVTVRIVDDAGVAVPADGESFGELMVAGPWVASGYFGGGGDDPAFADGWFRTGDVATMDGSGNITLVDRAKDVIKSGGEWISSIALEAVAASHPAIAEAAVIPVHHPRWEERPLLLAVPAEGAVPCGRDVLAHFRGKVAAWWVPDAVIFVDALPHTATGKLAKLELKERYRDALLGGVPSETSQVPQKVR